MKVLKEIVVEDIFYISHAYNCRVGWMRIVRVIVFLLVATSQE